MHDTTPELINCLVIFPDKTSHAIIGVPSLKSKTVQDLKLAIIELLASMKVDYHPPIKIWKVQ